MTHPKQDVSENKGADEVVLDPDVEETASDEGTESPNPPTPTRTAHR